MEQVVKDLLKNSGNYNDLKYTLMDACMYGDMEMVEKIFRENNDFNHSFDDNVCMKMACLYGYLNIIEFLLDKYVNVCIKYDCIIQCFVIACIGNELQAVQYLYKSYYGMNGWGAVISETIIIAFEYGYYDIVDYLIQQVPHILFHTKKYKNYNKLVEYVVSNNLYPDYEWIYIVYNLCEHAKQFCVEPDNIYIISMVIDKYCAQKTQQNFENFLSYDDELELFEFVCSSGLFDIAKLLKKNFPDMDQILKNNNFHTTDLKMMEWINCGCYVGITKSARK